MSKPNEIKLDVEPNPTFKFEREMTGNTRVFSFEHQPHLGLLSVDPEACLIPGLAFSCFNPSSLEFLHDVRVGDMIQVRSDINNRVYQAWGPPQEFVIPEDYSALYRVRMVTADTMDYPIIIADEAI
jgi:hypothetical protein